DDFALVLLEDANEQIYITDEPSMLTTRDPDIAEKVEAEDVWLQDLVQGYYSSMCPALADELLSAICRTANIQKISSFLKENSSAKVVGMDGKPRRTLKRRSRGVPWHTTSKAQKSRHDNGKKPNARNRKKNAQRKAKAKKRCYESECASWSDKRRIQKDEALWLCMDTQTRQCGGKLSRQRWKTCAHRGFGRLCFRRQDCEQYWDVLVSVVRLPLLVVWRLLELYFDHCPVLSAQAIGCSLGLVEADGTSVPSRPQGSATLYYQLYGMVQRAPVEVGKWVEAKEQVKDAKRGAVLRKSDFQMQETCGFLEHFNNFCEKTDRSLIAPVALTAFKGSPASPEVLCSISMSGKGSANSRLLNEANLIELDSDSAEYMGSTAGTKAELIENILDMSNWRNGLSRQLRGLTVAMGGNQSDTMTTSMNPNPNMTVTETTTMEDDDDDTTTTDGFSDHIEGKTDSNAAATSFLLGGGPSGPLGDPGGRVFSRRYDAGGAAAVSRCPTSLLTRITCTTCRKCRGLWWHAEACAMRGAGNFDSSDVTRINVQSTGSNGEAPRVVTTPYGLNLLNLRDCAFVGIYGDK
ncbi:unnamed protein product, partial [Cladocopium goreaui]